MSSVFLCLAALNRFWGGFSPKMAAFRPKVRTLAGGGVLPTPRGAPSELGAQLRLSEGHAPMQRMGGVEYSVRCWDGVMAKPERRHARWLLLGCFGAGSLDLRGEGCRNAVWFTWALLCARFQAPWQSFA